MSVLLKLFSNGVPTGIRSRINCSAILRDLDSATSTRFARLVYRLRLSNLGRDSKNILPKYFEFAPLFLGAYRDSNPS